MATIYAKNKLTGEWERVGPAANATDSTLTLAGSPADAKATGEAIDNIQIRIENLTAEDVGALPSSTEIPSIEGLASEAYVNERITEVVGGAPELLNTLDELSAALNDDENFANTMTTELSKKANSADLGALALKDTVEKTDLASDVQTSLGKADTALQSYTETDPTVPDWAKAESKPSYDFSELTVTDPEAAKTALAIENGMVLKELQVTMPSSQKWNSIAYGDGRFVAVSNYTSNTDYSANAAYSTNGIDWIETTLPMELSGIQIVYGGDKFVAIGSGDANFVYSTDGINWINGVLPGKMMAPAVTYGGGKFFAVSVNSSGSHMYSADGITWTKTNINSSSRWDCISYGNNTFVVVKETSEYGAYKINDEQWTSTKIFNTSYASSITYGDDKFVVIGRNSNVAAYSEDGITWTETSLPVTLTDTKLAYGDNKFVAISTGTNNTAIYSENGIDWIEITLPETLTNKRCIGYADNKFIIIGYEDDTVAFSYDGITWYDSIQYISQNDTDVTADTLAVLKHTHDEYLTEQVQADLSQTDSTQVDYVKGVIRQESLPEGYPYKEQSETVVLPEKVVTLADVSGKYISSETATFSLVPGNTYKVIWDGETYFMECKGYSVSGLTIPYFGNFSLIFPSGENTGEDFCIAIGQGNLFQCVGPAAGDYVVAISEYSETIHPMAPEFLPESATAQPDWNQNDETAPDYVKNRTHWSEVLTECEVCKNTTVTSQYNVTYNEDCGLVTSGTSIELNLDNTMYSGVFKSVDCTLRGNAVTFACFGNHWIYFNMLIGAGYEITCDVEDTGEKYVVLPSQDSCQLMVFFSDSESHIIDITLGLSYEAIHKIQDQYLPAERFITVGTGENAEIFNKSSGSIASGNYSHAEGNNTIASGNYSHAEGNNTIASGWYSHAEGCVTEASKQSSHAEGNNTIASGDYSHAEGYHTTASGRGAHAEGNYNVIASGDGSHAEGSITTASGSCSHAEGANTIAASDYQHTQGRYNIEDADDTYLHIVGNGSYSARSNAHTLDWDGNAWFAGDVYVGSTSGTNKDEGSKILATQEYVDIRVPAWTEADEGKVLRIVNGVPTWATIANAEGSSY